MKERFVSQTLVTHAIRMNVAKRNNSIRFRGFDFTFFFPLLHLMFVLALSRFTVTFQPSANIDFHLKLVSSNIHSSDFKQNDFKKKITQSIYCGIERM